MSKNVLLTGGRGFIGTNLIPRLLKRGHTVRVLDNLSRCGSCGSHLPAIDVVQGDIRNLRDASDALVGIDAVVHLAAYGSVVESISDPRANFDVNVLGTLNLLHCSAQSNVSKFILASTGGALIGNAEPPVNEQSLPRPISPYGASKLCGEAYCHAFAASYGMQTIALRFANVYGPYSAHKRGAINMFARALLRGEPIVIFGEGSASRDFLFVDDLCNGIALALDTELPPGSVFHLASGVETRIKELAGLLASVAGKGAHPILHRPARRGEVERNFADFGKAKEVLGFQPSVPLRRGLEITWNWFLENRKALDLTEMSDS